MFRCFERKRPLCRCHAFSNLHSGFRSAWFLKIHLHFLWFFYNFSAPLRCAPRNHSHLRTFTAISLLVLLLYYTGRVWVVAALFEHRFAQPTPATAGDEWVVVKMPLSLPYTTTWENTDSKAGLLRHRDQFYNITRQHYANDTLYTVMKTNQNARERFFALADEIKQQMDRRDAAASATDQNPLANLLKLLGQSAGVYLGYAEWPGFAQRTFCQLPSTGEPFPVSSESQTHGSVTVPPPEKA